jgi:hypothetical protein
MATNEKLKKLTQDYLGAAIEETRSLSAPEAIAFWQEIIQVANRYSLSIAMAVVEAQEKDSGLIVPDQQIIVAE